MPWLEWPVLGPVAVAFAVRLIAWAFVSPTRLASDEESYYQISIALTERGLHDVFWPPVTAWLISLLRWLLQTDAIPTIRLAWIVIDLGSVLAVFALAQRVSAHSSHAALRGQRFATVAALGYALYLPAISYAQFMTSETPALLLLLLALVILTGQTRGAVAHACAGLLTGTLVLTRPSLLPLVILLPVAGFLPAGTRAHRFRSAAVFVLVATAVVGAGMYRTWRLSGEATIATNSAYNLYIGNRDMYAEDLNLLHPRATPEQIEFRRQQWSGELVYPSQSPSQLQREALAWIASHPAEFSRRALGRFARVFVPRTDVLELVGGEQAGGVFTPRALVVLAIANLQWTVLLFVGILGLSAMARVNPEVTAVFAAAIAGSVVLCLVAISKPRYSFMFDPLLLIGATWFAANPRAAWQGMTMRLRWALAAVFGFLLWGWAAWLVFAMTSRAAL
jgi:hypothetical protein